MTTITRGDVAALARKRARPARRPGEFLAMFVLGRLVNGKNQSRGWQMKAWGRYKREWKERTLNAILFAGERTHALSMIVVPKRVTFHATVRSAFDSDGLQLACVPIRDALVYAGILDDDRDSSGHEFVYSQEAKRARDTVYGVRIGVSPR